MKLFRFIQSMKFGMLLLGLILALSLAGSLIPQGNPPASYQESFGAWHGALLFLQFDDIFASWYFITLLVLLCLNLTLCSVIRLRNTMGQAKRSMEHAKKSPAIKASSARLEQIRALCERQGMKQTVIEDGGQTVYHKNAMGFYGSFITHLALLLTLILSGCAMWLSDVQDHTLFPGETASLSDGTSLILEDFRSVDDTGRVDYVSRISIKSPQGIESGEREVSVNYPVSFDGHKYYQMSYGTFGSVTVTYQGIPETIIINEPMFLSLDGSNGIMLYAFYPDYVEDADGRISVMTGGEYINPLYALSIMEDGENKQGVIKPGETLQVGGVLYSFNAPVQSSTIRVKTVPAIVMGLLYASFALMVLGLYMCFFMVPVYVCVTAEGYSLTGLRRPYELERRIEELEHEQCVEGAKK